MKVLIPKNNGFKAVLGNLSAENVPSNVELLRFRGEDIPKITEGLAKNNKPVLGITGEDLFEEYLLKAGSKCKLRIIDKIPWAEDSLLYGKPTLALLLPNGQGIKEMCNSTIAINKKYYFLAKRYLDSLPCKNKIMLINGETEQTVKQGLAEACIEIICTGKTAFSLGLTVSEKIFSSDLVIIGNGNILV